MNADSWDYQRLDIRVDGAQQDFAAEERGAGIDELAEELLQIFGFGEDFAFLLKVGGGYARAVGRGDGELVPLGAAFAPYLEEEATAAKGVDTSQRSPWLTASMGRTRL